jgi:hypothetical protein
MSHLHDIPTGRTTFPSGHSARDVLQAIAQQLEEYQHSDPPSLPPLAAPLHLIHHILQKHGHQDASQCDKALADCNLIAFYFLLLVGEYTYANPTPKKCTHPITATDITLWCNSNILNPKLPLHLLLQTCTQASINIRNQKNGKTNAILATRKSDCPIAAIICRLHYIHSQATNPSKAVLSTYFQAPTIIPFTINARLINSTIRTAASDLNLVPASRFPLQ